MNSNANNNKRNKYYSDEEDKIPKDPIELATDNEGSDFLNKPNPDVKIISRTKNDFPSNLKSSRINNISSKIDFKSPSNSKPVDNSINNTDQLRNKIKEQAHRLQNLETYKVICERKIRQLVPNHPLPVTEADLKNNLKIFGSDANKNLSESSYIRLLENKEQEISELIKKIDVLENRLRNNQNTNKNNLNNNLGYEQNHNYLLPSIDKIPNDKLKESYHKLFQQFKEIQMDREQILESLRVETLNNEEQRNYIEILKHTIESSILKQGLGPIIQQQKNTFYNTQNNSNVSNLDVIIDICKLKSESDKYRKDLVLAQVLITELKQEIEFLHKTNEDMNIKRERIKENLDSGIMELEEAKERLTILEAEKEDLNSCYENLLKNSEKLREELGNSNSLLGKYEKELHENAKRINDLQTENENNVIIQNKMLEYKKSFEKIYEDFEVNLKEKNRFESELIELKEEMEIKQMELNRLKINSEEREIKLENEKKTIANEAENIYKNNKKFERTNAELENAIKEREREIIKYQDKYNDCERALKEFREKYDNLEIEFEEYIKSCDKKIDNNEKTMKEMMNTSSNQKNLIDNINKEKDNILNELISLKNQHDILKSNNSDLETELEIKNKNLQKLNNEYEKLFKDYTELENERKNLKNDRDSLNKELRSLKDKFDNEIYAANNDINRNNSEISALKNEIYDLKEKNLDLNENLKYSHNQIDDLNMKIRRNESEIKILHEKEEELKKKTEQLNILNRKFDNISREKEDLMRELNNKNGKLEDHLKKNNFLEEEINDRENEKSEIINQIKKLEKEIQNYKELNENFSNKIDKLTSEYQRESKLNSELTEQNRLIGIKAEELANALEVTLEDKELLQKEIKNLVDQIQNSKKNEKDSQNKLQAFKSEIQEIRVIAYSTQAILKTFCFKFYSVAKENNNNLLTKQFCENIKEYFEFFNNQSTLNNANKDKNFISILKFLEDCTRSICSEMEIWYDKIKNLTEENKEYSIKAKTLEQNLHNLSLTSEERIIVERKLNQNLFELKEENKNLSDEVNALEQQCEKLVNDYKQVRNDLKKKLEEMSDMKHEIRELSGNNSKLNNVIKDKDANISYLNFQILALEDCIVIISKEKKNLENLVNKISKCHPAKEMQKLVNEMLTLFDNISQIERDKSKIEQNLKNLDIQFVNSSSNQNNNQDSNGNLIANSEVLTMQVKIERENLRNTIEDMNKRINEKKEIQRKLEGEMRVLEINEKRNQEIMYDYDYKLKQLTNELNDAKEEINNSRGLKNTLSGNRDHKMNNYEEFSSKIVDNTNNNYEFDYTSRANNLNPMMYNYKNERNDSYPSQDISNRNYNSNNDYQYVSSSGYDEMNNRNTNNIIRKYKKVGSYFD